MIGIRQINRVYLTLGFLGVVLLLNGLSYVPNSTAWLNGRRKAAFGYTPLYYGLNYEGFLYPDVYGTHDWIAESALQLLFEQCAGNQQYGGFIQKLYAELKYWYLLGSELPDSRTSYYTTATGERKVSSGYSISIKTRCDNWVQNDVFTRDHGVAFSTGVPLEIIDTRFYNLLSNVMTAWQYIVTGFMLRDCEYVAYYMGALAHLISDAVYYPHTLHGLGLTTELRSQRPVMDYVNRLTNEKYNLRTPLDFFDINQARIAFDQGDLIPPTEGTYMALVDTRYGNAYTDFAWVSGDYLDAMDLLDLFSTESPWPPNKEDCDSWDRNKRIELTVQKLEWGKYFQTIEHQLNTAIFYIAAAINFLASSHYGNCDCEGEIGEDGIINYIHNEQADWVDQQEGPWEKAWLDQYNLSNIITIVGLMMALVAVSVSKKLSLLTTPYC